MSRKFKVIANIPVLGENSHQSVIVEGSSWMVALGKAARMIKKMPVMHRRRVTAISLVLEQQEGGQTVEDITTADNSVQSEMDLDNTGSDTSVVEAANEAINQAAADEAERLIVEGPIED